MTFFASPIITRVKPLLKSEIVVFLLVISFSIVEYFTIGPATSCGNSDTYIKKLRKLF